MSARTKARLIAQAATKRKARSVRIMDMRRVANFTDFFVIAGGDSSPQLRAISEEIVEALRSKKLKPFRRTGDEKGGWILIDCGDVVAHVFHSSLREYYQLESLWGDAPTESVPPAGGSHRD